MPAPVSTKKLRLHWFGGLEPRVDNLWLVDGLLPAQGTALLYAEPQCAKSFLALDLAFHIAEGKPWFERTVRTGAVIYVAAEGGEGLRNRVEAIRLHTGIREACIGFVFEPIDLHDPKADSDALIAALQEAAHRFGREPAAIVIDTLSKTFGAGKENTDDMRVYVSNAERIANACRVCVILVHHRPKYTDGQKPRGHSSLEAGVDTAIMLTRLPVPRGQKVDEKFFARVIKQKDGLGGERLSFSLRQVVLAEPAPEKKGVTSCIVVPGPASDDDMSGRNDAALATGNTAVILDLLREELNAAERETGRRFVSRKAARGRVIKALADGRESSRDTARRTYLRAETSLVSRGSICISGDRLTDSGDIDGT